MSGGCIGSEEIDAYRCMSTAGESQNDGDMILTVRPFWMRAVGMHRRHGNKSLAGDGLNHVEGVNPDPADGAAVGFTPAKPVGALAPFVALSGVEQDDFAELPVEVELPRRGSPDETDC